MTHNCNHVSLNTLRQKILAADQAPSKTVALLKQLEHVSKPFFRQSVEEQTASVEWIDKYATEFRAYDH